jgi:hypothetical protein
MPTCYGQDLPLPTNIASKVATVATKRRRLGRISLPPYSGEEQAILFLTLPFGNAQVRILRSFSILISWK